KYWSKHNQRLVYCAGKKDGIQSRGAMYMWRCLLTCYNKKTFDILDTKKLSKITLEEFRTIFQDDSGNDVLPELEKRHKNWLDLATKLNDLFEGKTLNIIKSCNNSLIKFTNSFRQFKAFDDPLSKMIMVNAIMHQGRGLIKFEQPIIPGMDYQLLKQLLRQGVIVAPADIEEKIKNYELLDNNEAMELRKAGLFALHEIMNQTSIPGDYIDNMIWGNRTKCEDEEPICMISKEEECPFHKFCSKKTELMIPLEDTRYY
ncbi:iron-sulfur cluster loop containing protein, partial [Candidatus Nitrosarchaeum limnium]